MSIALVGFSMVGNEKMSLPVSKWLFALTLCGLVCGCAQESTNVKRVEVDVQKKSQAEANGFMGKPSPVYSTSFAIHLAELALKERGIMDCSRRSVAVSYCDGVYSVTFEKPEDVVLAKDYIVEINADTSRIMNVDAGQR